MKDSFRKRERERAQRMRERSDVRHKVWGFASCCLKTLNAIKSEMVMRNTESPNVHLKETNLY